MKSIAQNRVKYNDGNSIGGTESQLRILWRGIYWENDKTIVTIITAVIYLFSAVKIVTSVHGNMKLVDIFFTVWQSRER